MSNKKQLSNYVWEEKYRPPTIQNVILPRATKTMFNKMIKAEEIVNLLLVSNSPGTGKSSSAKALCNDIKADYLYINASSEGNIDLLRDRIQRFATTKSFNNKPKIVILDEIEGSSAKFQDALRAFIEQFYTTCRFILTCNYISRVIKPLQSRCKIIDFNMQDPDVQKEMIPKICKRMELILEKIEKIPYDKEVLFHLVKQNYPDIRKTISMLQQFVMVHDCLNKDIFKMQTINDEFYELILNKNFLGIRKYIEEKQLNCSEMYSIMFDNFIQRVPKTVRARVILILADYDYKNAFVSNPVLNFAACVIELMEVL